MSLVLLTVAKLRSWREAAALIPRVVMTSEQEGVMPSPSHIYPEHEMPYHQYENVPILS